jgi:hypothetical protein
MGWSECLPRIRCKARSSSERAVHPPSHEEDLGKWVYPCRPPVHISQNDTCNSYWVHQFSYFKIWDPYCFNGVAWESWATGLYLWSILRTERLSYSTPCGQRRKNGTRILIALCDSKWWHIFFAHKARIKFVVDTSGWHIVLIGSTWKTPTAMVGGPRGRRRSMAQNWPWGEISRYYY